MTEQRFFEIMKKDAETVNLALKKIMEDKADADMQKLVDAEAYSLLSGGKRIRPILALAFCRMFGGKDEAAIPFACALEMVHTASLIHDDLPCIDDDELRRGRPTNHVVFGESTALLAADGLLMDSYGIIASNRLVSAERRTEATLTFSAETGTRGLCGGEFIDILGETERFEFATLKKMHVCKTGALIRASAILGSLAAEVPLSDERIKDAKIYAEAIGLAFQIIDDVLDVIGTAEELGKNPGADAKENKTTYLSFFTLEEAKREAEELTNTAIAAVSKYENCDFLVAFANYLLNRRS